MRFRISELTCFSCTHFHQPSARKELHPGELSNLVGPLGDATPLRSQPATADLISGDFQVSGNG